MVTLRNICSWPLDFYCYFCHSISKRLASAENYYRYHYDRRQIFISQNSNWSLSLTPLLYKERSGEVRRGQVRFLN